MNTQQKRIEVLSLEKYAVPKAALQQYTGGFGHTRHLVPTSPGSVGFEDYYWEYDYSN